jgi:hypothetical protein
MSATGNRVRLFLAICVAAGIQSAAAQNALPPQGAASQALQIPNPKLQPLTREQILAPLGMVCQVLQPYRTNTLPRIAHRASAP